MANYHTNKFSNYLEDEDKDKMIIYHAPEHKFNQHCNS